MSAQIGLPYEFILKKNLRVPTDDFVATLLATEGERIGRTDGRSKGLAAELVKRPPPYNDPAISSGGSIADLITSYLVQDLKFATSRRYVPLAMEVNASWRWTLGVGQDLFVNLAPNVAEAMRVNPRLRVFATGGYYDLATPILGTMYELDHANLPPERVVQAYYEAGHSVYQHESNLKEFSTDVRAFLHGPGGAASR